MKWMYVANEQKNVSATLLSRYWIWYKLFNVEASSDKFWQNQFVLLILPRLAIKDVDKYLHFIFSLKSLIFK